jgi:hypothetical protein
LRFLKEREGRVVPIGQQAEATAYVLDRQRAGAANGTSNRELAMRTRMLHVAYESGKVLHLAVIRQLKESVPRQASSSRSSISPSARSPEDLQVAVAIEHTYGWRCPNEVVTLGRRQLHLGSGRYASIRDGQE